LVLVLKHHRKGTGDTRTLASSPVG
jgi:hypothetical protein